MGKLSKPMLEALTQLAERERRDSAWNNTMQALRRRGFAAVRLDSIWLSQGTWRITDEGRAALAKSRGERV